MDKDTIFKYGPLALVVVSIILQWGLFVTPERLEIKHREILKDVAQVYSTKEQYNDLKGQLNNMSVKIDKIYDIVTLKK